MKRLIVACFLIVSTITLRAQQVSDLFNPGDVEVHWLGIDYSHVKVVGGFVQLYGAADKDGDDLRDVYFPAWNNLILAEPKKYDVGGMINKVVKYDIGMMLAHNAKTKTNDMEVSSAPNYSDTDIQRFVKEYNLTNMSGIGILFIAESLDKVGTEGIFHFVAIRNSDKTVLMQQRLKGKPAGFGIRNYWAGAVYSIISDIKKTHYKNWKAMYK